MKIEKIEKQQFDTFIALWKEGCPDRRSHDLSAKEVSALLERAGIFRDKKKTPWTPQSSGDGDIEMMIEGSPW